MNLLRICKNIFIPPKIQPFDFATQQAKGNGFSHNGQEYIHYSDLPYRDSAFFQLTGWQKIFLVLLVTAITGSFLLNWHASLILVLTVLTVLYFFDLLFNLTLIIRSFLHRPEFKVTKEELLAVDRATLPFYTVFCPLYKEVSVLPQFITAMTKLNYPKEKLEVMLLLEEDDVETIASVQKLSLPAFLKVVIVPDSLPKTKPKALNYGLTLTKSEYIVIYDAEDVPEENQLLKAVVLFQKLPKETICLQAKLSFYNPTQNLLTRVFTAEYSLWFDLVLTGLHSLNGPIPLGGTSNHFKTAVLRELGGWDPFNVTEDADLGIRLFKKGYRTAILDSVTLEEANSNLFNWFTQRTRWIKGYIQTYLVHMRRPQSFIRRWNDPYLFVFQLVIGGKIASMLINPFMWLITAAYFLFRPVTGTLIESLYPGSILYISVFTLVFGNFLYLSYYMIGCYKKRFYRLCKFAFLVPFYWLGMSISAWIALYESYAKPHYWSKTKHGLHLTDKKSMEYAEAVVGSELVDSKYSA